MFIIWDQRTFLFSAGAFDKDGRVLLLRAAIAKEGRDQGKRDITAPWMKNTGFNFSHWNLTGVWQEKKRRETIKGLRVAVL